MFWLLLMSVTFVAMGIRAIQQARRGRATGKLENLGEFGDESLYRKKAPRTFALTVFSNVVFGTLSIVIGLFLLAGAILMWRK